MPCTCRLQIAFSELHPLDHIEVQPVQAAFCCAFFSAVKQLNYVLFWDHTKVNISDSGHGKKRTL